MWQLGYDNMTGHDVLRQLLPAEVGQEIRHDSSVLIYRAQVEVPTGFETIGHVLHLNLKEQHAPYERVIADVLLDKVQRTSLGV